jgi:hypothetical protein
MTKLKCSACCYEYESIHIVAPCPRCNKVGKISLQCTCVPRGTFIGVMQSLIKKNPNCPVHKNGSGAEK